MLRLHRQKRLSTLWINLLRQAQKHLMLFLLGYMLLSNLLRMKLNLENL